MLPLYDQQDGTHQNKECRGAPHCPANSMPTTQLREAEVRPGQRVVIYFSRPLGQGHPDHILDVHYAWLPCISLHLADTSARAGEVSDTPMQKAPSRDPLPLLLVVRGQHHLQCCLGLVEVRCGIRRAGHGQQAYETLKFGGSQVPSLLHRARFQRGEAVGRAVAATRVACRGA